MTPQEKAKELFDWAIKYGASDFVAREFSIKIVDEIQNTKSVYVNHTEYDYWEQVKQEIEKL